MGIEPTYLAWKASVLPLNYTRVLQYTFFFSSLRRIGVTGFEPATPCSQSRCSSQTEPHPVISEDFFRLCCFSQRQELLYNISFCLSTLFLFFCFASLSDKSYYILSRLICQPLFSFFVFFIFHLSLSVSLNKMQRKMRLSSFINLHNYV